MVRKLTSIRAAVSRDARAASSRDGRIDEASLVGMHVGDRYRLRELIGEGGMGGVFRAEQVATGRIVALKMLHPELAHIEYVARRFEREAEVASRLSHPHIVEILDFGQSNGHLYIAMELLVGESLGTVIERGTLAGGNLSMFGRARRLIGGPPRPVSVGNAVAIMHQVLAALEHAHGRGVVHRDLKPENIMLLPATSDAAPAHVKLLDFGIAKLADDGPRGAKPLTQAGVPLGTPEYMSPEQAAGDASDARSDLYSCGVVLYEMLTGRLPFESQSAVQLLSMQVTATPPPLRVVAPHAHIPEAIERVVLRALAKNPDERFASARALSHALDDAMGIPRRAAPIDAETRAAQRYGHARWLRVAVAAAALGFGALVIADHHAPPDPPAPVAEVARPPEFVPPRPLASARPGKPAATESKRRKARARN